MKPAPFSYHDARLLDEALDLLAEHGQEAAILAGGQSLVPLMNVRLATPALVIDINRIPGLDTIRTQDGALVIGALARASVVERNSDVARALPVMQETLGLVGHPQIRNRTTVGGSVAHADPAAELPTLLAALDGRVVLSSLRGERTVSWEDFFRGPFTTARDPDELVTAIRLPTPPDMAFCFVELARRHGDFAVVGACVGLRRDDGRVGEARIALCGVGGTPMRARQAEEVLVGRVPEPAVLARVQEAVVEACDPPEDVHASSAYRRHVSAVLVGRSVGELWERSRG